MAFKGDTGETFPGPTEGGQDQAVPRLCTGCQGRHQKAIQVRGWGLRGGAHAWAGLRGSVGHQGLFEEPPRVTS